MAAGTHTIAFVGQAPNTGDSTAFLDAVSLVGLATATPSGASAVRWTVYDGPTPLLDFDGSGTLTARYLSVPGAIDELLARQTASGVAWYLDDREGSVKDLINNSGAVLDHVDYTAYGQATDSVPTQGDRFKYAGMEFDAAIGLYYDRARFYDPAAGRFTSLDPLQFGGGSKNIYSFTNNNPSNFQDVTGKDVRIENTGGIGGFHQRVGVDRPRNQDFCISYGAITSWNPYGNPFGPNGVVYQDDPETNPTSSVSATIKTSPAQDKAIIAWLDAQLGEEGQYNVIVYSCRTWSHDTFDKIRDKLRNGDFGPGPPIPPPDRQSGWNPSGGISWQ